ncbi:hypothetical protein MARPO_0057s0022 [Marchantia polymorpha]|uniref:Secreted protein n=1 Tax=Marchantia polymorpha TaxID=3197 RepID=A0A2R6WU48_MARPO|nr:hypothetical protein MARPO_0057s0022 [Marchantia polymorpha]|eukprot:PTQ37382.1 hypothetical protein MARPO_0057s0022 [Marchantia polymorpha]
MLTNRFSYLLLLCCYCSRFARQSQEPQAGSFHRNASIACNHLQCRSRNQEVAEGEKNHEVSLSYGFFFFALSLYGLLKLELAAIGSHLPCIQAAVNRKIPKLLTNMVICRSFSSQGPQAAQTARSVVRLPHR